MGLPEDEVMTYRLEGGALFYSCWARLDEEEKQEAHATMQREALAARKKAADASTAEVSERAAKMGL